MKGLPLRPCLIAMAKFGDHPALPQALEDLLMEQVHTVFLKADCPPRVKQGSIGELRLVEVESEQNWDTLRLEAFQEELVELVEENRSRSDCFLEIDRKGYNWVTCASPVHGLHLPMLEKSPLCAQLLNSHWMSMNSTPDSLNVLQTTTEEYSFVGGQVQEKPRLPKQLQNTWTRILGPWSKRWKRQGIYNLLIESPSTLHSKGIWKKPLKSSSLSVQTSLSLTK